MTTVSATGTSSETAAAGKTSEVVGARKVIYCGVCSLPPEYCEFGGTIKRCEEWLKQHEPELHERLYSDEAVTASLSTLSVEAQARATRDASKKAAKAEAKAAAAEEQRRTAKVQIKRVERNKRKYVTAISGLEQHGLDLKKVAKDFGKKFATGSSVTKTNAAAAASTGGGAGGSGSGSAEEIVVQGDLAEEIEEWIVDNYVGDGPGKIPDGNVEIVVSDSRAKKGGGGGGGGGG